MRVRQTGRTGWGDEGRRAASLTALVAMLAAAGCGDLTSGGLFGDLEVVVAADSIPFTTAAPPQASGLPGDWTGGASRQAGPSDLAGTLTLRVQVFVLDPPRHWVEVTDGPQEVVMDLESTEPVVLAHAPLAAGRYPRVRTVFRRVEANVARGLIVDGQPVTGVVRVQLGDGDTIVVDDPTEVEVPGGGETSLLVELHTARWLRLLNLELRQVAAFDFQEQVRLRLRP